MGIKLKEKMPPKHWMKGSDDARVIAERKEALPLVIRAMVPTQKEMLPGVVCEFLRMHEAWEYWQLRGTLQKKCSGQEDSLKEAERACQETKDTMRNQVQQQEAETARIIREATEELARVKLESDRKIHGANMELERVRQETFHQVAGKQTEVAGLKQELEETHSELGVLANRVPPLLSER
eukprot:TRINITY_DN9079_c0_g1_i2.p1 TRINITY_DN9079_c0_g1~~TRINITY_DN9079_c0_g1_i2.p1  ORF type:complete len:181 (+),score=54.30 TRINITY_DN9079_c0_g1_i2:279-821(+)